MRVRWARITCYDTIVRYHLNAFCFDCCTVLHRLQTKLLWSGSCLFILLHDCRHQLHRAALTTIFAVLSRSHVSRLNLSLFTTANSVMLGKSDKYDMHLHARKYIDLKKKKNCQLFVGVRLSSKPEHYLSFIYSFRPFSNNP